MMIQGNAIELEKDIQIKMIQLEQELVKAVHQSDVAKLTELMDPEGLFIEDYQEPVNFAKLIAFLAKNSHNAPKDEKINFKIYSVSADKIIVTYESIFNSANRPGNSTTSRYTDNISTSVWKKDNHKWLLIFHQKSYKK